METAKIINIRSTGNDLSPIRIRTAIESLLGFEVEAYTGPIPDRFDWGRLYLVNDRPVALEMYEKGSGMSYVLVSKEYRNPSHFTSIVNNIVLVTTFDDPDLDSVVLGPDDDIFH